MNKTLSLPTFLAAFVLILQTTISCNPSGNSSGITRLALVQYNDSPLSELSKQGIEEGLAAEGWTEGTDYEWKVYNAQGDVGTLNMIFDAVTSYRPKLIFVTSTPTLQVAIKKIRDIPVVFSCVADPVLAGAGTSFENHLPNVTGISTMGDYQGMAELVRKIFPELRTIGTLYTPGEINSVRNMEEFRKHAADRGMELITIPVNSSSETSDAAASLVSRKPEIVCQIIDNLTSISITGILKVCQANNIPVFGFISDQVEKGAILVISRDYEQAGMDAARLARKILGGENPASLPFEFVSKTNLLINREAAARHGVTIPREVYDMESVMTVN